MSVPVLDRVEIVSRKSQMNRRDIKVFLVRPVWRGVDCPAAVEYSCETNKELAKRLGQAILAGKAWLSAPVIDRDVKRLTYVNVGLRFNMKFLHAELTLAGF